jgi:hypothetical protein
VHPAKDWNKNSTKDAYLFPSRENKAKFHNVPLKTDSLRLCYVRTIEEQFPKLLDRPDISLEDKAALRSLIYDKPHFPYLRRHEFSTEIVPRTSRQVFSQLVGHSPNSTMQDFYIHEMGNEGVRELEIIKGIRTREETVSPPSPGRRVELPQCDIWKVRNWRIVENRIYNDQVTCWVS